MPATPSSLMPTMCRRPSTAPEQDTPRAKGPAAAEPDLAAAPGLLAIQGQRYELGARRPSAAPNEATGPAAAASGVGRVFGMSPSRRPSSYAIADCLTSLPPSPALPPLPPKRAGSPGAQPRFTSCPENPCVVPAAMSVAVAAGVLNGKALFGSHCHGTYLSECGISCCSRGCGRSQGAGG